MYKSVKYSSGLCIIQSSYLTSMSASRKIFKGPISDGFLVVSFKIHFAKYQTYLVSTASC